ncbi:MAG: GNAT family N-acetyltransferase [Gemmataceae bacterium]|nr:GNAT family N-acetyltransferase [Gemmataceae bacterium]
MPKLTYFKRHRMEVDLRPPHPAAELPFGYWWLPWHDSLLDVHAEVKHLCFQLDLDAVVFPSLGHPAGCRELMLAIRGRPGFCPGATWLVVSSAATAESPAGGCVATVQGLIDDRGLGAIQNLGVVPDHRGRGLGRTLLLKALAGFAAAGAKRAFLEVTARNEPAVGMYRSVGFRNIRTIYKGVEVPEPAGVGAGV